LPQEPQLQLCHSIGLRMIRAITLSGLSVAFGATLNRVVLNDPAAKCLDGSQVRHPIDAVHAWFGARIADCNSDIVRLQKIELVYRHFELLSCSAIPS
jgi:hypothetical protein